MNEISKQMLLPSDEELKQLSKADLLALYQTIEAFIGDLQNKVLKPEVTTDDK